MASIGDDIRWYRKAQGLSVARLAERVGVTEAAMRRRLDAGEVTQEGYDAWKGRF